MNQAEIDKFITRNPGVLGGKPVIRGTRIPVYLIAGFVESGHSPEQIVDDYPDLTVEEVAIGPLTFRHEPSREPVSGEIAGHLHPGARIVRRGRSVRCSCFASDGDRMVMPAFGAFTGTLNVLDRACAKLFRWSDFNAYMMGTRRIYPIAGALLSPG